VSPARRRALVVTAVVLVLAVAAGALVAVLRGRSSAAPAVAQDRPGPVLLVPGYGGSTSSLTPLAQALRRAGRTATVVPLPGDGTGDLAASAASLGRAVDAALAAGAPSVDVVGYSAGGVVARLWARDGGARQARRVVTLGSPHHGTGLAALGATFVPGACGSACQELVPGSPLLDRLNRGDETPSGPQWLSLWTQDDTVVTPPTSARLAGASDVALQQVCPGRRVAHGELPGDAAVQAVVLEALSTAPVHVPGPEVCAA
jgi:triacylglycerol esterase/lipase EstA (alpha/beta hydrolase family)